MSQINGPTAGPAEKEPRKGGRRKVLFIIFLITLLSGLAGFAHYNSEHLADSKWGRLLLAKGDSQPKDVYYCPMHPSYKSDKPGTCPICNMNLEKLEPKKSEAPPKASSTTSEGKPARNRKILYWRDPMNPANKSDKPGKAPCGMDLEPVYAEETSTESLPTGTVKITPQKQQLIGVQYGEATEQPLSKSIRTIGRVTYNETKIARIQTKVEGWIERVFVDFTGQLIKKGETLISIYSPQLVSTQQELIIARRSKDSLGNSPFKDVSAGSHSLYESTLQRLRLLDISDTQIKEIERNGSPSRTLTISSPISGFVLARNAFPGQRITPETELYTIADLTTVWVLADVYEYELPMVRLGQTATMTLTYMPGKTLHGKVSYVYPELDKITRTLKVRLEFPNPDLLLKPDMFANVELKIDLGKQVSIPDAAVLDSGSEQVVFVALEGGYFEPRKVELGAKVGDRYIVLSGLTPGEKIVTSGNFLIDSESQLKSAMSAMGGGGHAGHGGTPPSAPTPPAAGPAASEGTPSGGSADHAGHGQGNQQRR